MKTLFSFPLGGASHLICGVMLLPMLTGCAESADERLPANTPAIVRTTVAVVGDAEENLRLPARAVAGEHVLVHARATGIVAQRHVDLGDTVAVGQVLAVIQAPEVDQALRETQAQRQLAQASAALAQTHYERARKLVASNAISRELYDERHGAWQVAQASLAAASARLNNMREQKSFQLVRAPIDGVITARNIERGDRVIADQGAASTPLFELSNLDPLRIVVDVPQSTLPHMTKGQKAHVSFAGFPDADAQVEVVRLGQRIDSATGGMRVELLFANARQRIRPGMTGNVVFSLPQSHPSVRLPISAVMQGGDGARIIVVDSEAVLELRQVRLGRNLGDRIEVVEGVAANELVVLAPSAQLKDGDTVQLHRQ